jgi:hypothetical protein
MFSLAAPPRSAFAQDGSPEIKVMPPFSELKVKLLGATISFASLNLIKGPAGNPRKHHGLFRGQQWQRDAVRDD